MRQRQHDALQKLIDDLISKGKLLLINQTADGKTLVMQMGLTLFSGVVLILGPLLELTKDQGG